MMRKITTNCLIAVPLLLSMVLVGCFEFLAGGTEIENPEQPKTIAGRLVYGDGSSAAGAKVSIRSADALADTTGFGLTKRAVLSSPPENGKASADTTFSTVANDSGFYSVDTGVLDPGTYVIECADEEGNLVLIDSVVVENDTSTFPVAEDTLKPAGALKGVITLSEGGDPRKVFVLAFGIDRFAAVNAEGSFKFENLAEANYDLRIISTLDEYGVLDTTGVTVASGDTTDLDTLELPFEGIPTVMGLRLSYDTLAQIVTLTWNAAEPNLISGYRVYRKPDSAQLFSLAADSLFTDTMFVDGLSNNLIKGKSYQYMIRAVDLNGNEGLNSMAVTAEVYFYVDAGRDAVYELGDSVLFAGTINTEAVTASTYRWDVDADGTPELDGASNDTLKYMYPDTGSYRAVFSALVDGGTEFTDTVQITVISKDTAGAPSAPRNEEISYDTLKQIVTLTWSPNFETDVVGYKVYRRDSGQNGALVQLNGGPVTDTVYHDSTGVQDSTYEYQISAVDVNGNEGELSGVVESRFASKYEIIRSFGQYVSGQGETVNPEALGIGPNGLIYLLDNPGVGRVQVFDSTGGYVREFEIHDMDILTDMAVFGNYVYVIGLLGEIRKYSIEGDSILDWKIDIDTTISIEVMPKITVDSQWNVYVKPGSAKSLPAGGYGKIQVYDSLGVFQSEFDVAVGTVTNIDMIDDKILITCLNDSTIYGYSPSGSPQSTFSLGFGKRPVAITNQGSIYVLEGSDYSKGNVFLYSEQLDYMGRFGRNISYIKAQDLAVSNDGTVYILDSRDRKITQFR